MATYEKIILSGSTDNIPIVVSDTATLGETIHECHVTPGVLEEIYLWACNVHASAAADLTIEMGAAGGKFTYFNIPANTGLIPVVPGIPLNGNATELLVTAFADAASKIVISGYVIRTTP